MILCLLYSLRGVLLMGAILGLAWVLCKLDEWRLR